MKKRLILSKFIIYMVLLAGIVLSVTSYFYVENRNELQWKQNQRVNLELVFSNIEKDFYHSLLKAKSSLSYDLLFNDTFKQWSVVDLASVDKTKDVAKIIFEDIDKNKEEKEIASSQIEKILAHIINNDYYLFTLDGKDLYVAFVNLDNKAINHLYISKLFPRFEMGSNYKNYVLNILNEDGKIIYNKSSSVGYYDYILEQQYSNANVDIEISVFLNSKGLDGFGGYSILFMGLILFATFALVFYLFRQNSSLNALNYTMHAQSDSLKKAYALFKKITGNSFDLITVVGRDLKIEYANSAYARVLNHNPSKLNGMMLPDLVPEKDKDQFIRRIKNFDYNRGSLTFDFEMMHSNKKDRIIVESMVHAVFDESGNILNYMVHCKDITSKRESLKALLQSKRRFKDFADSSADWLWESDNQLKFIFISSGVKSSIGYLPEDLIGKRISHLFYNSELIMNKLANDRGVLKDIEIKVKNKDKQDVWLRISAIPVYSESKGFVGYRGVGRNITEAKQEQEKVIELATKDYLTGLLNRSAFMYELNHTVNLAKRTGTQGALLFIDLDMFKMVNDSHGHDAGDKVLKEVSRLLSSSLRETDILGRIGGDEFAVVMNDINPKEARKKITELSNSLSRLKVSYNDENIQTTSSIGVVKYPSEYQDSSQLLTMAGLAMHKAKDMGRNRVYMTDDNFFEDSFSSSAKQKMKWLNILRDALENEAFEMHFQPMIPTETDSPVIFESLLRIRDENNNLGSPVYFIEAAENFGLAQSLDVSVLKRCIQHHKQLLKQNKSCMLSINISGLSLGDDVVLNVLKNIVEQEKPETDKIIIEVTETAAMRDEKKANKFVAELHRLGFKFALDDFGSGYSSFHYLKNLDVDYVKIDGEFIKNIDTSIEDRFFVKAIADLAKGLGIKIIAEFVENQTHVNILKEIGIDYVQGYHISKPIGDLDDATALFDNKSVEDI